MYRSLDLVVRCIVPSSHLKCGDKENKYLEMDSGIDEFQSVFESVAVLVNQGKEVFTGIWQKVHFVELPGAAQECTIEMPVYGLIGIGMRHPKNRGIALPVDIAG